MCLPECWATPDLTYARPATPVSSPEQRDQSRKSPKARGAALTEHTNNSTGSTEHGGFPCHCILARGSVSCCVSVVREFWAGARVRATSARGNQAYCQHSELRVQREQALQDQLHRCSPQLRTHTMGLMKTTNRLSGNSISRCDASPLFSDQDRVRRQPERATQGRPRHPRVLPEYHHKGAVIYFTGRHVDPCRRVLLTCCAGRSESQAELHTSRARLSIAQHTFPIRHLFIEEGKQEQPRCRFGVL